MLRSPRPRVLLAAAFSLACSWLLLTACADATQIRLFVYTDVPCTDAAAWHGVAIYVGKADANLENKAPALSTTTCDANGQVGSLVLVPSDSKDEEVGLRVVAGISRKPEECASSDYQGCIVARRAVRFSRHATLDLEVGLTADCRGIGCDPAHTCVDGTCNETKAVSATPSDAPAPDAQPVAKVRCGDDGVFCPTTGNVCCLTVDEAAGTAHGECRDPSSCIKPSITLYCDDESDCVSLTDDQGRIGMCTLAFTPAEGTLYSPVSVAGSECVRHAGTGGIPDYGLEMCETRMPCLDGTQVCVDSQSAPGHANPLPGYHYCVFHT